MFYNKGSQRKNLDKRLTGMGPRPTRDRFQVNPSRPFLVFLDEEGTARTRTPHDLHSKIDLY